MNSLVVFNVAVIACTFAYANEDFRIIDSIYNEAPCSKEGGICTLSTDCPKGKLADKRSLCPIQRSQGIECCHGVSVKETRCKKRGGGCVTTCNSARLIYREATDCPKDTTCCILVK